MKRITVILLCILLCVGIVGCTVNTEITETADSSAPAVSEMQTDSTVPTAVTSGDSEPSDKTDIPTESTPSTTETSSAVETHTKPEDTESDNTPPKITNESEEERKPETPPPHESEKKPEDSKPEKTDPEETKPQETLPPKEDTKPTEPEKPADPYAYPFDINEIRRNCIAQGVNYGFSLDESLTPDNASWAGAETASSDTQGTRLKKLLSEMIEYYSPVYREDMELPDANISAFNIYCEPLGNNTYRIYFLFLV